MAEVIGGHADLIALRRARRLFQQRQIDGGVANQRVRWPPAGLEARHKVTHARLRTEINLFQ
jgi:hypothetical protein